MNKPTERSCDSQRIDDYLNERLSDSQQAEFETHLSGCEQCQQELQRRAAEPEIWDHAVALLGQPTSASVDEPWEADDNGARSRQVQSVLDSLSPTDDPEMLGRIDDYEIIGVVGVGGMGAVLKGFDKSLRRVVAIKVMAPHLAGSGSARTRFQREARAAAAITHDNVIDIYGVSEAHGLPYLVMPYARGPSLQKRIDDGGPLSVAEVLRIGRQIAAGLNAAHEQGLVHRDIKPANILLNDGIERLLITDFGVARAMDDASMTRTGVIAGTPQYMSPEQARGEAVDYRSDLFSLGSILYTACTGRPPFRSEAAYGILRRITDDDPRPIREINPDIPDWLCRIVDRLMAKHPADRFQNAADVAELLEGCLAHLQQPTHVALPQSVASLSRNECASPQVDRQVNRGGSTRSFSLSRSGVWIMISSLLLAGLGFVGLQMTAPADIAGQWQGESWTNVSLSSVVEATDWYTGSFTNADGQQGAVQLEWSRLQRRYNGRWKVGDGQSGSITLRAGDAGSVRGAVSVDADAKVAADTPRLREFSWKRGTGNATGPDQNPLAKKIPASDPPRVTARAQTIQTPIKGVIVRWGAGMFENAHVKKGALIAEIRSADATLQSRLADQLKAAKQQVAASETLLTAVKRNAEASRQIAAASEAQRLSYQAVKQQIAAAAQATVASAQSKIVAEEQQVVAVQAAVTQLKAEYERVKANYDETITSQKKFEQVERSYKEAEANLAKSKANADAIKNDMVEKQNEGKAKELKAQADIDYSNALLLKAESDVAKAESDVAKAQSELTIAQKLVVELETKLTRQESVLIVAPFDGYVVDVTGQRILKEGDQICRLWPESAVTQTLNEDEPTGHPAAATTEPAASGVKELPASSPTSVAAGISTQAVIATQSLMNTFGPVSDLTRRLRESREKIKSLESNLESRKAELDKVTMKQHVIEVEIAQAQEQAKSDDPEAVRKAKENLKQLEQHLQAVNNQRVVTLAEESSVRRNLEELKQYLADAESERDTIIKLLQSQLAAAEKQLELQSSLLEKVRRQFGVGNIGVDELLRAEQPVAETEPKIQQLKLLLEHYRGLGDDQTVPQVQPTDVSKKDQPDPEGQPNR